MRNSFIPPLGCTAQSPCLISSKLLRRQFETNVFGLMDVTTAALPYLRKSTDACIVVIGSRSVWTPEVVVRYLFNMISRTHIYGVPGTW